MRQGERINGDATGDEKRMRGAPVARLRRARAGTALTSFDDIRKVAHALPSVVDGTSYGTPALKVGGKLFARLHQSIDCVVLRLRIIGPGDSDSVCAGYILHHRSLPGLSVDSSAPRRGGKRVLPELIERAWRLVASKTLIKKQDERRLS